MIQPVKVLNKHDERITIGEYDYIKEKLFLFYGHNKDFFGKSISVKLPVEDKKLSPDYPVVLVDRDFDHRFEMPIDKYKEYWAAKVNDEDRIVRIKLEDLVKIR